MRHLECADPEQTVDGIEVQTGGHCRGVGDLESELGLDQLSWLVVNCGVLIWLCSEVITLAGGALALKSK